MDEALGQALGADELTQHSPSLRASLSPSTVFGGWNPDAANKRWASLVRSIELNPALPNLHCAPTPIEMRNRQRVEMAIMHNKSRASPEYVCPGHPQLVPIKKESSTPRGLESPPERTLSGGSQSDSRDRDVRVSASSGDTRRHSHFITCYTSVRV
ncbi:uncharacterized protein EI90DRAFT_52016 [Cantharellus anzutake]|uniref:uncharacterized protein n=1 Tax=Cantharellus anzutake TaxID=1750568 RepID=UPI001907A06D|nr:uncharacterized protein EI90DRAFT_52016 [Cantharellus anzutake]KAF8344152.1 hypothetical protein EI90DRAFT_52016 [Cantharellus anzutake]